MIITYNINLDIEKNMLESTGDCEIIYSSDKQTYLLDSKRGIINLSDLTCHFEYHTLTKNSENIDAHKASYGASWG